MRVSFGLSVLMFLAITGWGLRHCPAGEGNMKRKSAAKTGAGTWLPSERRTFKDAVTGVRLTAITTSRYRDNKIYQTHPSWTRDGEYIVFMSDRVKPQQVFAYRVSDGGIVQITDHPETNAGQVYISRKANRIYHGRGRSFVCLDFDRVVRSAGQLSRKIWDLPGGWNLSGTFAVDADERSMYVGLARDDKAAWAIHQIDLATGKTMNVMPLKFHVGHLQANPVRPGVLMFCHETGGDASQRMYIRKSPTADPRPFYRETYDEWVTHEVWWGPDEALFTIWPKNEKMRAKPHGIARVRLADYSHEVISRHPYWHVCGIPGGRYAVGDTFAGELFLVDAKTGQKKLLTKGHRPKGSKVHAHQSGSPNGKQVLFCSEMQGSWDLMLADIPKWNDLPD